MTVLDALLEQIDLDEAESYGAPPEWGDGVFEMPFSVAKALLQIAEAAFEMPLPLTASGRQCEVCWAVLPVGKPHFHMRNCPWQRIQDDKKELEGDSRGSSSSNTELQRDVSR